MCRLVACGARRSHLLINDHDRQSDLCSVCACSSSGKQEKQKSSENSALQVKYVVMLCVALSIDTG